jgi:hypothetical protein
VTTSATDGSDTLAAVSVATAVREWAPEVSAEVSVSVHAPLALAVVVPSSVAPS